MTDVGRQHIARDSFHNTGIAFFESSLAWWRSPPVLATRVDMNGLDLLHSAAAQGHGVILLGAHYIHLEYIGAAVSSLIPIDTIYRPQNNAALEAFVRWRRRRIYTWQIDRRDVRMIYRAFRVGHVVWYTGDQDSGTRHAVFAPFFGVPAATVTAASRFVGANQCVVFSVDFRRDDARRRYVVDFTPVAESFGENEEIDALTMNRPGRRFCISVTVSMLNKSEFAPQISAKGSPAQASNNGQASTAGASNPARKLSRNAGS
jgi:KDO2-lipid IV(A) lauroyltransferase